MTLRTRHLVGGGLVLLTALASALAYPEMPAEMVTHWGTDGPDGSMGRTAALALLPALALAMLAMFELLPRIDPLGEAITDLEGYYDLLVLTVVGLLAYVHGVMIAWNLGYEFDVVQATAPAVGAVLFVAGVVLERVEKNWFVGIRTPWTLSSERVWEQTHERGAPLFKLAGVLALGAVAVPEYGPVFLVGPVAVSALYLTVYSYLAYRRLGPDEDASV
jgi:uncharacterized membrane protein